MMVSSSNGRRSTTDLVDITDADNNSTTSKPKLTFAGKVLLGVTGGSVALFFAVSTPFLLPAIRRVCLPYVPATDRQVQNVLQVLKRSPDKKSTLIDLGSGDGRIVIAAARYGLAAAGVELNPWLVWYSRWRAWRTGCGETTSFHTRDLWKVNLGLYDNVVVFGVPSLMEGLEEKLSKELKEDAHVIACRFPMPNWSPVKTIEEGIDTVWLYKQTLTL